MNGDVKYLALLDEMRALHLKKAADYGTDGDPLANLRGSVDIGVEPWRAAYLRALDKVRRINTYCVKGSLENEGVRDSLIDLASYALLSLRLFDESPGKVSGTWKADGAVVVREGGSATVRSSRRGGAEELCPELVAKARAYSNPAVNPVTHELAHGILQAAGERA